MAATQPRHRGKPERIGYSSPISAADLIAYADDAAKRGQHERAAAYLEAAARAERPAARKPGPNPRAGGTRTGGWLSGDAWHRARREGSP